MIIDKKIKIYVAGHKGLVGSSCVEELNNKGYHNIVTRTSHELDLRVYNDVFKFLKSEKPVIIIMAAAKVGGINANNEFPYDFLMDNMKIQNNILSTSKELNIPKVIFLGSSCIYPKFSTQPIKEEYLLTGELEPTNQWYAIAKISGLMTINSLRKQFNKKYISLMPTNLYGPNDNFDLNSSHVIPALIRKFYEAKVNKSKVVELWGSGLPKREFLHVKDLARAIVFAFENSLDQSLYNVGSGEEISIKTLAALIKDKLNFSGNVFWNSNMPDGTPRKILDSSRLNELGWNAEIKLNEGLDQTINWFIKNYKL